MPKCKMCGSKENVFISMTLSGKMVDNNSEHRCLNCLSKDKKSERYVNCRWENVTRIIIQGEER